jgi:uncharacterized protein (TIGR00251 family)
MSSLSIQQVPGGIVFTVKVVPGSSKTAVAGLLGSTLKIKVSAPPEKGKANESLVNFLAERLGVRPRNIEIIAGTSNPVKQIRVEGITPDRLTQILKT